MSIGTGAALAIGGIAAAAGGIGSAALGSSAAKTAANTQQAGVQAGIDETKREFNVTQANEAPWIAAGTGALSQLTSGTAPGGSLVTPFGETYQTPTPFSYGAFTAPTLDNTNDPGYAFRHASGEQALQRGAAASGGGFSGGTLAALTRYGQDYASNEYQNVYNRALTGYNTNFSNALNTYDTNTTNALNAYNTRFNAYNTGQTNQFNRLASLAGTGQTATNTLANLGANSANNVANLLTSGANAGAAGILGSASAINSGINAAVGGVNNYASGSLINMLTRGSGSSYNPNFGYGGSGTYGVPGDTTGYG
jgi:hypothetical protein